MKTVVVVRPAPGSEGCGATWAEPTAQAFEACFKRLGWDVTTTTRQIEQAPDLIAGYGWRPVMREAWERWPDRVLHTDLGFWSRETHLKVALGGRWSALIEHDYDAERLNAHKVKIRPSRAPGQRVLLCGMSEKAAGTFGLHAEEWERMAVEVLRSVGAKVTYRPKPSWPGARPIHGAKYDRGTTIEQALAAADVVVSHHSNAAIDALAAGLPIYVETGIAKSLSVSTLEDAVGAEAPDLDTRGRFLRQVAYHQWTLKELSDGAWLQPPAPLATHPIFVE